MHFPILQDFACIQIQLEISFKALLKPEFLWKLLGNWSLKLGTLKTCFSVFSNNSCFKQRCSVASRFCTQSLLTGSIFQNKVKLMTGRIFDIMKKGFGELVIFFLMSKLEGICLIFLRQLYCNGAPVIGEKARLKL